MADTKPFVFIYTLLLPRFAANCHNVCITNDLESGFEGQFTDCTPGSRNSYTQRWYPRTYRSSGLDPPHRNSTSFIRINSGSDVSSSGCVRTSQQIIVTPGSMFQVKFYANTTEYSLHLRLVNHTTDQDIVTWGTDTPVHPNGWNVMDARFHDTWDSATGYIQFDVQFRKSPPEDSCVLIDSYRYVSNPDQLENCKIYPDIADTACPCALTTVYAEEVTVTQKPDNPGVSTTTEQPVEPEDETDSDEETDVGYGKAFKYIKNLFVIANVEKIVVS